MLFEFEPFGVNDAFLRLKRNGGTCIAAAGGVWNRLIRLNYLVAPNPADDTPHLVFHLAEVGWDGDRFRRRGRAAPLVVDPAMVDALCHRGLISMAEASRLIGPSPSAGAVESDEALMLRAALGGCTFTPIHPDGPRRIGDQAPPVVGYALRTLSEREPILLDVRHGLPVLTDRARSRLTRDFG
jgi:hypothetical protein